MSKTSSTFNLSKSAKRMLATYVDKHRRAQVKAVLIDAESTAEVLARTRGKSRAPGGE